MNYEGALEADTKMQEKMRKNSTYSGFLGCFQTGDSVTTEESGRFEALGVRMAEPLFSTSQCGGREGGKQEISERRAGTEAMAKNLGFF